VAERFMLTEKYDIGNRTRDLPACSIVPQPTTLPRARTYYSTAINEGTPCGLERAYVAWIQTLGETNKSFGSGRSWQNNVKFILLFCKCALELTDLRPCPTTNMVLRRLKLFIAEELITILTNS
jgi:hypothetical protein